MILTLLCLCHEHMAKPLIPYYQQRYEVTESANRFVGCWEAELIVPSLE